MVKIQVTTPDGLGTRVHDPVMLTQMGDNLTITLQNVTGPTTIKVELLTQTVKGEDTSERLSSYQALLQDIGL